MTKEDYDLLVNEMDTISRKVALFPKELQASVYKNMVETLLGDTRVAADSDEAGEKIERESSLQSSSESSGDARNYASEIEEYYNDYNFSDFNDMEVATFTAYYFGILAPKDLRTDTITASHYEELCTITGRKFPKNSRKTLNNAKNIRGYLDSNGSGIYSLTKFGEHFVKNTMLKEKDK